MNNYLSELYYNPKNPASFGGPSKLYQAVKNRYSLKQVRDWLQGQEAYSLHRPVRRTFPTNRVLVEGIDDQWDADLMDMSNYANSNNGIRYVLLVIDIFSKYVWLRPLHTKTGAEVREAFASIQKRTPKLLRTDKGKEFTNNIVERYLKSRGIHHFVTQNEGKANYAERAIKTIKNHIQRYMTHHQKHEYVDILPDVNQSYNTSFHTTIGMTPKEVTKHNEKAVWWLTYWPRKHARKVFKFKIGDVVRIPYSTNVFTREYDEKWTGEVFKVTRRFRRDGLNVYTIADLQKEPIKGSFYQNELAKTSIKDIHRVEKVIKERKVRGRKQYFVKWKYYPDKFNTWVNHGDLYPS